MIIKNLFYVISNVQKPVKYYLFSQIYFYDFKNFFISFQYKNIIKLEIKNMNILAFSN